MNLKKYFDAAQKAEARVQEVANQVNELFEAGKVEEALALRPELDKAKNDAAEANKLYISMKESQNGEPVNHFVPVDKEKVDVKEAKEILASEEYKKAYFEALRAGATPQSVRNGQHSSERFGILMNAISTTGGDPVGSEGGFLNPVDFDNMIHERMRQFIDLANPEFFNVEDVVNYSGWRVIEAGAAEEPFDKLTELNVLGDEEETESPTFQKVDYTVEDYGGFLRLSNSQLSDTPVNLMRYISKWFGKKVVLTNNSLILALVNALTPTNVADYKTLLKVLKTTFNKTLDPAIAARSKIYTNQSGFDLMDQLDDGTGRPLLQPDPTNQIIKRVLGRQVVVLSDAHWPNLSGPAKARIAVGDGTEYLTFFRRMAFEMASTTVGGAAWRSNSTEVRGIMRADATVMDDGAMTLLAVTLPS